MGARTLVVGRARAGRGKSGKSFNPINGLLRNRRIKIGRRCMVNVRRRFTAQMGYRSQYLAFWPGRYRLSRLVGGRRAHATVLAKRRMDRLTGYWLKRHTTV
jgi:hypothetical protein